jgi:hypothetical protein
MIPFIIGLIAGGFFGILFIALVKVGDTDD